MCVCVCVCVCLYLSGFQKLIIMIISSLHHVLYLPGGDPFRHVRLSVCPFVLPGPGVCPGLFAHLADLRSTPNHFQTLPGHADKKHTHIPRLPVPPPPAAGCACDPALS